MCSRKSPPGEIRSPYPNFGPGRERLYNRRSREIGWRSPVLSNDVNRNPSRSLFFSSSFLEQTHTHLYRCVRCVRQQSISVASDRTKSSAGSTRWIRCERSRELLVPLQTPSFSLPTLFSCRFSLVRPRTEHIDRGVSVPPPSVSSRVSGLSLPFVWRFASNRPRRTFTIPSPPLMEHIDRGVPVPKP